MVPPSAPTRHNVTARSLSGVVVLAMVLGCAPAAAAAREECGERERSLVAKADEAWVDAETSRLQAEATAEWALIQSDAEACLAIPEAATRRRCARPVATFLAYTRRLEIKLPATSRGAESECRNPETAARFGYPLTVRQAAYAEILYATLRAPAANAPWPEQVARLKMEIEHREHEHRLAAIDRIRALLRSPEPGATKLEMLERLAELYFEEGQYVYLVGERDGVGGAEMWVQKSADLLGRVRASFGADPFWRGDETSFRLGLALVVLGRGAEADATFSELIRVYPESRFVPYAAGMVAEHGGGLYENRPDAAAGLAYALYRRGTASLAAGDVPRGRHDLRVARDVAKRAGAERLERAVVRALDSIDADAGG